MKSFLTTLFMSFVVFGFASTVSAHATPISYEPEATSIVQSIPARVAIQFSERIEPHASGITVYGPDGSAVDSGDAKVDSADSRLFYVPIKDGGQGTYTVSWQVVSSDDGHFTKGAFAFSVGKQTGSTATAGQIQIQHITTIPQAGTIGIELMGQALILGVLLFLAFLWRPLKKKFFEEIAPFEQNIKNRFTFLLLAGVALIVIGTVLFIILKTFDLQQLRPGDFVTTLKTFLGTVDGSHAFGRMLLGLFCIPLFLFFRKAIWKSEKITKAEIGLGAFLFLMLLSRARVSHAAASHFHPWFSIGVNAFQLLFKEMWVGGVIVFCIALLPFLLRLKDKHPFAFFSTLFSQITSVALAGVGVTGAYIVWLHLKDPAYLFTTEWGSLFIVLSLIGGALLLVRLYNQFYVEKLAVRLSNQQTGEELSDKKTNRVIQWSLYTLPLEAMVGIALIFVTSLMIITTPPYATERYTFEKDVVSNGAEIQLSVHPYEASNLLVTVEDPKKHTEIDVSNIVITITNEDKNIGPIVVTPEQRFIGGYVFPESLLTPAGGWKIDITAERPNTYDAVASFNVNYPTEIAGSRIDPDKRTFGGFETIVTLSALLILLGAYCMYRFSKKLYISLQESKNSTKETGAREKIPNWILSWALAFVGLIIISGTIWFIYDQFVKTDFQKLCEKNGHFWLQSIPMKDGVALSSDTVTGCFLDVGLYHFADEREYEFFYHKRDIIPQLAYTPTVPVAGEPTNIMLSLSEAKDGVRIGPVTELGINHDRILHVLIVGEDLKTFAHIHSEDLAPITDEMKKTGQFPLRYTFPKAGRYALNIDYVASGIEYTNVVIVSVAGSPKMVAPPYNPPSPSDAINKPITKVFDGYTVTFSAPTRIKPQELVSLHYYIAKDGKPVTNLEPYLSAAMHLGMIRNDLGRFFHTHGEASQPGSVWFQQLFGKYVKYHMHFAPDQFGPRIITPPFATKFTTPGTYTIFGEFKVEGKVIVTDFEVQVE